MSGYMLETGIALWRPAGGRPSSEERKLMEAMEVGQSFLITHYDRFQFVRGIVSRFKPKKFSIRKSPGGWRIWRVE